jgi:phage shock protein PspC (stress-responsive transcriptional regulator)
MGGLDASGHDRGMNTTTSSEPGTCRADQPAGARPRPGALMRSRHDRMLGGVAAGVAGYVGADVSLIRIAFVVLALVGGLGIPLYLACWLLIPDEYSAQSIAAEFTSNRQA